MSAPPNPAPAARVFISYRTSDGADKATALARDLALRFGADPIFLDKADLPGGSRWREVIAGTLAGQGGEKPVVLLLVTPQLFGARDAQGRLRIELPDDPVRAEFTAALAADAHLIPVLCDGVDALPDSRSLPAPFDQLGERTWRRLRAYDWDGDVARLCADLTGLGVVSLTTAAADPAPISQPAPNPRRRLLLTMVATVGVLGVSTFAGWAWRRARGASDLSGMWSARLAARGATTFDGAKTLKIKVIQQGRKVTLVSAPLAIDTDPAWAEFRADWQKSTGWDLNGIVYRLTGEVSDDVPDVPPAIDTVLRVETVPQAQPIDGGELRGQVHDNGRRIAGRVWLNSEQAERLFEATR